MRRRHTVARKRQKAVGEFHVPMPRIGPVIAEREYRLVTRSRKRQKVHLRFGKPRRFFAGYDLGLPLNQGTKRLVHKDPKADRAMKKMLDLLDPEGEYHPRPRKRRSSRHTRKNRV